MEPAESLRRNPFAVWVTSAFSLRIAPRSKRLTSLPNIAGCFEGDDNQSSQTEGMWIPTWKSQLSPEG
jgi:hypothetical protein